MERVSKLNGALADLRSSLRAVEFVLTDQGYMEPSAQQPHRAKPRPGIRIKGELSFRGKDKTRELFDRLDEDQDSHMTFEDFRAMKALKTPFALLDKHEFNKSEAWQMYLADSDIHTKTLPLDSDQVEKTRDGYLDVCELLKYRTATELDDGLTADLRNAGLGYLPEIQLRWGLIKQLIGNAFDARKSDSPDDPQRLNREDASFVLCNADICYSKAEYIRLMIRRARFEILSSELLAKALRNDLFLSPDRLGHLFHEGRILMPDDEVGISTVSQISPTHLTAWIFADRPQPSSPWLYQKLLKYKYSVIRFIRESTRLSFWLYDFGSGIRDSFLFKGINIGGLGSVAKNIQRGLASAKAFAGVKRDKVLWKSSVAIGESKGGRNEDGSGFYWKYAAVEKPSSYFERLHLPPESGSCISVDFAVRSHADENGVKNTANYLKRFLSHHFASDLSGSPQFKGIYVFPTINEGDGSRVLRCALCYKRMASVDLFLEYMHMDCSFTDFVTIFTGSLFMNIHIADLVDSARASVDDKVTITGSISCEYKRGILLNVLKRARLFFSAGVADTFFSSGVSKSVDTTEEARSNSVLSANTDKIECIRPLFPRLVKLCDQLERFLNEVTSMSSAFRFKNVSDFIHRWGLTDIICRRVFPATVASESGAFTSLYLSWCDRLIEGFREMFCPIRRFLERQNRRDIEAKVQSLQRSDLDLRREASERLKSELSDKLKALGIATDGMDHLLEPEDKTPEEHADDVEDYQLQNDAQAYQTFELMQRNLSGLHSCDIVLGKCKIGIVGQGLDIFDVLPEFESISELKRQLDLESRAATANMLNSKQKI